MVIFSPHNSSSEAINSGNRSRLIKEKFSYEQSVMFSFKNFSVKYFFEKECPRGYPMRPNFLIYAELIDFAKLTTITNSFTVSVPREETEKMCLHEVPDVVIQVELSHEALYFPG